MNGIIINATIVVSSHVIRTIDSLTPIQSSMIESHHKFQIEIRLVIVMGVTINLPIKSHRYNILKDHEMFIN